MSTSDKTFSQVKDILRKLDRSIDEAREKRLSNDPNEAPAPPQRPGAARAQDDASPPPAAPNRAEPTRSAAGNWMSR